MGNRRQVFEAGTVVASPSFSQAQRLLACVAQWIERHRPKVGVGGSSPSAGATGVDRQAAIPFAPCQA